MVSIVRMTQRQQRTHQKDSRKRKRQLRCPGVVQAAADLGVNRRSIYRVMTGQWNLPGLKARYLAWLKGNTPEGGK